MVGSTEDARISPYLLFFGRFWRGGWVSQKWNLLALKALNHAILQSCQLVKDQDRGAFILSACASWSLFIFIFLLRRLSGSQSWVRQYGIGRLSGTDGELHLCLPGNTQVSLIQSTACLMDNDLIILKTHFLSSLFFLASIVSFLSPPSDLAASLVWDIQSNLAIRLIF